MRRIKAAVGVAALAVGVAGCGQDHAQPEQHDHGQATVVASTDVWGSVASAVAGEHAAVKSIVISAAADPHSFEASPADAAAIAGTSVAGGLDNGGGYDHWVDEVLADRPDVASVNAYSLLKVGQPTNEHVFYNLDVAKAVADRVAYRLAEVDPGHADEYRGNASEFGRQASTVIAAERSIANRHPSAPVVATEPVAFYLLRAAGVTDRTPEGFANAVEEGDYRSAGRRRGHARPDQLPPGVGAGVQPADRNRRRPADRGRGPAGVGSGCHSDGDAAGGHRLLDLAAPDRRGIGQPAG